MPLEKKHPTEKIAHLDVDAFFASIEQRDDPQLRGRPVAVGTGVVASCSYEAKRQGVKTGMRLSDARQLCRGLLVLPGDHRRYELAGRQILDICREYSPTVEMAALDDLYLGLDVGDPEKNPLDLLRQHIHQEVGLRVSAGLGCNKLAASAATHHAKELRRQRGGKFSHWIAGARIFPAEDDTSPVVQVLPGQEQLYLAPWPVSILPGIGPEGTGRFLRLNVRQTREAARLPLEVFCGMFGKRGPALRDFSRGIDLRPVRPQRPVLSVSRCTSLDPPGARRDFLSALLAHLLERAISWMRFHHLAARGITVRLRYADYRGEKSSQKFSPPAHQELVLRQAAQQRFHQLYTRRLPLRFLGVELAPLTPRPTDNNLFPDPENQRLERLEECKDSIRQRFGFMSLVSGKALLVKQELPHDCDNLRLRAPCLTR